MKLLGKKFKLRGFKGIYEVEKVSGKDNGFATAKSSKKGKAELVKNLKSGKWSAFTGSSGYRKKPKKVKWL